MAPETSLAHTLRKARLRHGLTQVQLAARVGVSQGTISFWENGVQTPTVEHVIALALVFPEIVESFQGRERALLQRLLVLERELFEGKCACRRCPCAEDAEEGARASAGERCGEEMERRGIPMKIAVAGKGGVGKTTVAGTLARALAREGRRVLALDADSNPNLAIGLGISRQAVDELAQVPSGLTEWRRDPQGRAYVHLRQPVSRLIQDYSIPAPDRVRLMIMGKVVEASVGCRCEAHAVARGITGHLLTHARANGGAQPETDAPAVDVVILDMEAGLEHLSRGTAEHVDLLLVLVEPYYRALEAGRRSHELATQLGVPRIWVVANRVRTPEEGRAVEAFCQRYGLELAATIPFDEAVLAAEQADRAPIDHAPHSAAVQAILALGRQLSPLIHSGIVEG